MDNTSSSDGVLRAIEASQLKSDRTMKRIRSMTCIRMEDYMLYEVTLLRGRTFMKLADSL